ncbi:MAG TPA: alpha-(1-_3)-arabinofuranosyltransferase family protein [Ilumatobacteraceae bacterium]|nr:alpha-(1->3)-arabinofuranosyltransferase family protein [Ilumatobacteraceae bacterium]
MLGLLAYLPSLTAGRGRMPADTKLYLYLDPGRLVSDAPYTFDGRQFAGWVPHQTISYLWPSGPWYWLFETIGVPDWIAHRLWIGTILFAAGLGVRWLAHLLGIGGAAAVAAAALYQLSPFVLPYLSRTSLMLLPYAGLGWIIGLTMLAARRSTWRHAGLLALVVATVGAPNATATAMIVPAPVLWLVHAAWGGEITWRRAAATAGRIGGLCVAVSLWWLAMLSVQGRYGADVLAYSETLEAVSLTSTSTETLRGMGYWLFYVRDPVGFTTSAAEAYMASGRYVVTSFVLTGLGIAGLAFTRFRARRFAVLLVIAGIVLAVGVHPIDDPSLLMSPFADSSRSSLVLALRSSTRALPMAVLGLALGTGALVAATARRLPRHSWAPAAVATALAAANLPAAWNGGFVDPVLSRDQDPPDAWLAAASDLDRLPAGYRVMQLPGAEFGAFRWGYTVDPPLPGLTERPFVSRDLLPLGSTPAMDLLYALDDRLQSGIAESAALAPVARLFGVDTIWAPNDIRTDRFRSPRPEVTAALLIGDPDNLGDPITYGDPVVPSSVLPMVDERSVGDHRVGAALAPVWLVPVEDPVGVIRAKSGVVAIVGSGDGVVDAAAAGLIDGTELIVYTASGTSDLPLHGLIVTDSNRDQARQWRGSQDTRGFTESGGEEPGVATFDSADQRLEVFEDADAASQTVAIQTGLVTAHASAYGEVFAYRPEDRAAMAIDGDATTAWRVADRFDATGQFIELTAEEPVDSIDVVQPIDGSTGAAPNRWITAIDVSVDDGTSVRFDLDETSRSAGQTLRLPTAGTTVRLTIAATDAAPGSGNGLVATGLDAVGFAEIRTGLGPTLEVIRPPTDWVAKIGAGELIETPIDQVFTRLRVDPANRWRRDPEPRLVRDVTVPPGYAANIDLTLRLSARADDSVIAGLLGLSGATASERLTGMPTAGGWAATDGDLETAWITPFGRPIGPTLTVPVATTTVSTIELRQPAGDFSPITQITVSGSGADLPVAVPPADADGWSRVDVGALPVAGEARVTITGAEVLTTRDRRSNEIVALPAAVAEIRLDGADAVPIPAEVDLGCREVLSIDGLPATFDLGTVRIGAVLAGEPIVAFPCRGRAGGIPAAAQLATIRIASRPGVETGLDVDRFVLHDQAPSGPVAGGPVDVEVLDQERTSRTVRVGPCPAGCWVVLGEGLNDGWVADIDGDDDEDLGPGRLVDGGFNGWRLPPSDTPRTVTFTWTPQRTVTVGLWLSGLAVIACVVLAVADRRRRPFAVARSPRLIGLGRDPVATRRQVWAGPIVATAAGLLLAGPGWALVAFALAAVAVALGRARLLAAAALAIWLWCGAVVLWRVMRYRPFPNAGWPGTFEDLHRPGMLVLALLAGSLAAEPPRRRTQGSGQ